MIRFEHPPLDAYRRRPAHPNRREGGGRKRDAAPRSSDLPLVSVAIAVRNGERHLREALESVLVQSYPNIEIVIADGASTDGSLKILEDLDRHIDRWVSEPDRGAFDGMNRAIALSSGQLIKVHGHDDLLTEGSVEEAARTFARLGQLASGTIIRSDMLVIDVEGRPLYRARLATERRWSPAILHPTWYVPREVYERFGLYDTTSRASSDYEKFFQLRDGGVAFEHAAVPLVAFRRGGLSTTQLSGLWDTYEINRRYMGPSLATLGLAIAGSRAIVRKGLEHVLDERRSNRLRVRLKELLGEAR